MQDWGIAHSLTENLNEHKNCDLKKDVAISKGKCRKLTKRLHSISKKADTSRSVLNMWPFSFFFFCDKSLFWESHVYHHENLTIYILIFKLPDLFHSLHHFIMFTYIISSHKWSTTHSVLKSHRSKMGIIYMQSWKQSALLVITTMAFWQLMHLGTWCTVYIYIYHSHWSIGCLNCIIHLLGQGLSLHLDNEALKPICKVVSKQ